MLAVEETGQLRPCQIFAWKYYIIVRLLIGIKNEFLIWVNSWILYHGFLIHCIAKSILKTLSANGYHIYSSITYFYKWYVFNCILCIPKDKLNSIHVLFKPCYCSLHLTVIGENIKTINFLDITLKYDQGCIETKNTSQSCTTNVVIWQRS